VATDSDVVWHGSITSPDVTTFSLSIHRVSGSMQYLKQVSTVIYISPAVFVNNNNNNNILTYIVPGCRDFRGAWGAITVVHTKY